MNVYFKSFSYAPLVPPALRYFCNVTVQYLHSSDAKIHENRLRRWDFRTPASYSHDLRGSAPICSDQILLLYMFPALIHDGAHVVIRQRVKHGLTLTSAGHELCLL